MNSKDFMYKLIISQLKRDGHKSIAEELSHKEGLHVDKPSNDLLHVVTSINVEVKVNRTEYVKVKENKKPEVITCDDDNAEQEGNAAESTDAKDEDNAEQETKATEPTEGEDEDSTPKKTGRRQSGRLRKSAAQPVSKPKSKASLDKWLWKGNAKRNSKATVSTVDAVDLNESDSHMMVYAAMVHHAADSFIEQADPSDNPPSLEKRKEDDSPPELKIEPTAVESPKDRLPALDAEAGAATSTKDHPPKLTSQVSASSTSSDIIGYPSVSSVKRYINPAACDSPELDQLTSLDISPIKTASECSEEPESKEESKGKSSKKRKFNEVEADGPMLKWIEAFKIGKPAKRARKDEEIAHKLPVKGQQSKYSETFTYKNVTYTQPSLVLTRVKIHSIDSPSKLSSNATVFASTPKTTFPLKKKLPSSRRKVNGTSNTKSANTSDTSSPVEKEQSNIHHKSDTEFERDKQVNLSEKNSEKCRPSSLRKSASKKGKKAAIMSPVVMKSTENMNNAYMSGPSKRVKRSINLHSDGFGSDGDSWEDKVKDAELPNLDIVESSSNLGVMESFSVESESEDESFTSMQATVDNLLDGLPLDSPTSSPRAKKVSPKKRVNKRTSQGKAEVKKNLDASFDSDSDSPDKGSAGRPKTAAEKFAELMGE